MSNKPIKQFEIETYIHAGVAVTVSIDYDNGHISLVDQEKGSMPVRYKGKQWIFANRTIEYMQGWQNIFDAMKLAVAEATKKLEKHQEEREKAIKKKHADLMDAIAEAKKKNE